MTEPEKRHAYEPAERLLRHTGYDPDMPRPITITAGVVILCLRIAAGILWILDATGNWPSWTRSVAVDVGGNPALDDVGDALMFGVVLIAASLLVNAAMAVLVLRGVNWARVWVMVFSVLSISTAFVGWWAQGQEITLRTTLVSLALDILLLLALSSRSAAAYARRNERH